MSGVEPQSLAIDHEITVNPLTGSATATVPLRIGAGRDGFGPSLTLSYTSGAANSPFGVGWSLDGIPAVSVDLRRRYPSYDRAQRFQHSSVGELVPDPRRSAEIRGGYRIRRFVGRDQSAHLRVEQWSDGAGAVHWRTWDARGVLTVFGAAADGSGRVFDPEDPSRVLTWLAETQVDPVGNAISYEYAAENFAGVDVTTCYERPRYERARHCGLRLPQRHIKRIRSGNTVPVPPGGVPPAGQGWCFETVFDYGDHATDRPEADRDWTARPDPYSTFRPGFDLRTYRLCRRVLVFHHFDALGPAPVADYTFEYQEDPAGSTLRAIGYARSRADSPVAPVRRDSLPSLMFSYSHPRIGDAFEPAGTTALRNSPAGLLGPHRWIDLLGEGLPGILAEQSQGWYYKRNEGDGQFASSQLVAARPAYRLAEATIRDFDGDGNVDLVVQHGRIGGYYTYDRARDEWDAFRPFDALPHMEAAGAQAQWVDFDGDGRTDLLLADPDRPVWFPTLGREGFGAGRQLDLPTSDDSIPGMERAALGMFFADAIGDGGSHQIRIQDGRFEIWPHLGQGRFGAPIVVEWADDARLPSNLDAGRLLFADLSGTGRADLIYMGDEEIRTWINASGNSLVEGPTIRNGPVLDRLSAAAVIDYFGDGTLCLVWSSPLAEPAQPLSVLRLTDGIQPHLLERVDDGTGAVTTLEYGTSARHYLRDRRDGREWQTRLPTHATVVNGVERRDDVTGARVVNRYRYHDGYYDGAEQVFRGFGRVDIDDAETVVTPVGDDAHTVPTRRTLWHHLGTDAGATLSAIHSGDPLAARVAPQRIESATPLGGVAYDDALRAVAGRLLRQEIYALDDAGRPGAHPLEVSQFGYRVRPIGTTVDGLHAFDVYEAESARFVYEGQGDDPRVSQSLALSTDEFGQVRIELTVEHSRRTLVAPPAPDQATPIVTATETGYLNIDEPDRYELGLRTHERQYELSGIAADGVTLVGDAARPAALAALTAAKPFGEDLSGPGVEARVAGWQRYLYWTTDQGSPEPPGQAGRPALLHHTEQAVFTPAFAAANLAAAVDDALLGGDGRYTLHDGYWWAADVVHHYGPASHFHRLARTVRPDGGTTEYRYDAVDLLLTTTIDPAGNTVTAEFDYHHLLPWRTVDANGARTEVLYDAFGVAVATTHLAEVRDDAGMSRPYGFAALDSYVQRRPDRPLDALTDPAFYLQDAASVVCHDPHSWRQHAVPRTVVELTAETLRHDGTGAPVPPRVIGRSISYFDGFGRSAQSKALVEPGDAVVRGPGGALLLQADGTPALAHTDSRWLVSGHTATNRKGLPVRGYEPFYSATAAYEPEEILATFGVAEEVRYDALDRPIRVDMPDGTLRTTGYTAWSTVEADENDTVDASAYRAQRAMLPATDPQRQALDKALAHAGTPTLTRLDPSGNATEVLARGGAGPDLSTRFRRDSDGEVVDVIDARGITTLSYRRDMLGRVVRTVSADAGETRILMDAFNNAVLVADASGNEVRRDYDPLDRLVRTRTRTGAGAYRTVERLTYGDDPAVTDAARRQLRGRLVTRADESGTTEVDRCNPGGAVVRQWRRVLQDYTTAADWEVAATVALEPQAYTTGYAYDALGRPVRRSSPDGAETRYRYLLGGGLAEVRLSTDDGLVTDLVLAADADYNARAQRTRIRLGCGVRVEHRFDTATFRTSGLRAVRTRADGSSEVLQDISYIYDPVGNVVWSQDAAQEPPGATAVLQGLTVSTAATYTYDAHYRLTGAEGRVHNALLEHDDRPDGMAPGAFRGSRRAHLNDGAAVSRYRRTFDYDATGNLIQIRHTGVNSWTTDITVAANSNRAAPARDPNGAPAPPPSTCFDPSGNCVRLPHLRRIAWDHANRISAAVVIDRSDAGQPDDAEYYQYDSDGMRVRKTTVRLVGGVAEITDKLYLDGCEITRIRLGATPRLHRLTTIVDDDFGRIAAVHRWTLDSAARETDDITAARVHYTLSDHLDSAQLQLAGDGRVISYEEYFPYGGTSFIAADQTREVALKDYRFAGKERDEATGFSYYGHRYYAPALGRWLSPDPAGPDGGWNLYAYCHGNPVTFADPDGLSPTTVSRGNPVHYDTYDMFVGRLGGNVTIDPSQRAVGVQDKGGTAGASLSTEAQVREYARQHPGAVIYIYDPNYNRLRSAGKSDEQAAEVAEFLHNFTGDLKTGTLTPGSGTDPAPSDKPPSESPSDDPAAQGEGDTGGGQGQEPGSGGVQQAPPGTAGGGTSGPTATGGAGTGTGQQGTGIGGGGTGDKAAGPGDTGRGTGLGKTGTGTDARTSRGRPGGLGNGTKPGRPGGQNGTGSAPGSRKSSDTGVPQGGSPGVPPSPPGDPGIPGGDPNGTGTLPGGPPHEGTPGGSGEPGIPSNGTDPGGSRTGSLAGDRNGTGPGNGVPGGKSGPGAGSANGQGSGGSGPGKSAQPARPETALDTATRYAGYWNLEFGSGEGPGDPTGGIPGAFGKHPTGRWGQVVYLALTVADIIVTIVSLGQSIAAKGGIVAWAKAGVASVKAALTTLKKLISHEGMAMAMAGMRKTGSAAAGMAAGMAGAVVRGAKRARKLARPGQALYVGPHWRAGLANRLQNVARKFSPHHAMQNAVSPVSFARGITINIPHAVHALTRTFRNPVVARGITRAQHLIVDVVELRGLLRAHGYTRQQVNRALLELIRQNRKLYGAALNRVPMRYR